MALARPRSLRGLVAVAPLLVAAALDEPSARRALDAIAGSSRHEAEAAIARVVESGDARFAAVFIELLRAADVGLAAPRAGARSAEALEALTGERHGGDWAAWVRWYAASELEAPPGFLGFKGRLLSGIDPAFATLLRDGLPSRIRAEEIVWGGVAYEGIPALDRPAHRPAAEADDLEPDEPVFGVALGGEARAYPLRILDWHEMANDELGGIPFSLAYCTLCGSGIAYATRVAGRDAPLDFGSSGLLLRSNKLMVDRQTRTLWNQLTGRPVLGPLADSGIRLELLPSVVTTWAAWRARHPHTTVLSFDTGHRRPYRPGAAYAGYFASPETMFPVPRIRDELPPKARVFGLERDGHAAAWALDALLEAGVRNDAFAGAPVVLVADGPRIEVDGESTRSGPARYEAGATVRAYRRGAHRFAAADAPGRLRDAEGRPWRVEEEALVGPGGARLARVPGRLAYWFGWSAFHPRTVLHGAGEADAAREGAAEAREAAAEVREGTAEAREGGAEAREGAR